MRSVVESLEGSVVVALLVLSGLACSSSGTPSGSSVATDGGSTPAAGEDVDAGRPFGESGELVLPDFVCTAPYSGLDFGAAAVDGAGKLVTLRSRLDVAPHEQYLQRYTAEGVLDETFGTSGRLALDTSSSVDAVFPVARKSDLFIAFAGRLTKLGPSGSAAFSTSLGTRSLVQLGAFDDGAFAYASYDPSGTYDGVIFGRGTASGELSEVGRLDRGLVTVRAGKAWAGKDTPAFFTGYGGANPTYKAGDTSWVASVGKAGALKVTWFDPPLEHRPVVLAARDGGAFLWRGSSSLLSRLDANGDVDASFGHKALDLGSSCDARDAVSDGAGRILVYCGGRSATGLVVFDETGAKVTAARSPDGSVALDGIAGLFVVRPGLALVVGRLPEDERCLARPLAY
jgi:hypothetical protein